MTYISDELINKVWRRVGSMEARQVSDMQKRHMKEQKALSKFVYGQFLELREDAAGVGLYVYHVVLEAFLAIAPKPTRVRRPSIDRIWAPATQKDEDARSVEPHATKYVDDALVDDNGVALTEEERRCCVQVLGVAILCLRQACAYKH